MSKKTPEIRFKGFMDDWEQRKLGEVSFEFKSGSSIKSSNIFENGKYPVYGGNGVRGYTNTFNYDGDFALIGRQGALSGNMNFSSGKAYFTEHAVAVKANLDNDTRFLFYLMSKLKLGRWVTQSAQPGLAVGTLLEIKSDFPIKTEEQYKVGQFFKTLDNMIALHQAAIQRQQDLKKGLLQQLFPAKDEKIPAVRFTSFTEEWEQRKLGTYTDLITKGTTPKNKSNQGDITFIKVENLSNGKIKSNSKISTEEHENYLKRSKLNEYDILFSIAGTLGRTAIVDKSILPANTNQALAIIRGYKFDKNFLLISLNGKSVSGYIRKNPTVGAQPNLSLEQVGKLFVGTPNVKEQQKIGKFFKQLDDTIALHQAATQQHKNLKKSLLQKMFVN